MKFAKPQLEIVKFSTKDIIVTSGAEQAELPEVPLNK